ncbi:MAG: DPP IV N-terminal domain-containing protein [Chloroflexi bacterium]|nr:DPP IV N-terminal domain-containing protein [Chloroflexota bacterium]
MMRMTQTLLAVLLLLFAGGCQPPADDTQMIVSLVVDGRSLTYDVPEPITVAEFLAQVDVTLGDLDRVVPPPFTQISDGLQITVRRVAEETECEDRDLPFTRRTLINEQLEPGAEVLFQAGQNGRERQCFRVQFVDGIRAESVPIGEPTVLASAVEEIVYVGPTTRLSPVDIRGTLAYVSGGNAWVMRGSSDSRRPVTNTGDVDPSRAYSLSADGRQLLYTRTTATGSEFGNQLSVVLDVTASSPQSVDLRPTNVLWAEWVPGRANTVSYTRAQPRSTSPGWGAYNDLWLITLDATTGEEIDIDPLIDESPGRGGPFSWWGRGYAWSPDGGALAWVHADSVGLVDLESGTLDTPLVSFVPFTPRSDWSWRTSVSWSPDADLLLTVVHGEPVGSEAAERSPIFDVAVLARDGSFSATVYEQSGIWAFPKFAPPNSGPGAATGRRPGMSYLLARQPLVSVGDSAEYDLYVADVDGSNARRIFPPEDQRGITQRDYSWSPDGSYIAIVYQGNVWVVDVVTAASFQVTLDGSASHPVWAR